MRNSFLLLLLIPLFSCEDEISVDLKEAPPAYVVDAWINNQSETQVITLNWTQDYFDSTPYSPVSGASVVITDSEGNELVFNEGEPGEYIWEPSTSSFQIDSIGVEYDLQIEVEDEIFTATSKLNRVPTVDSLIFTFQEEESPFEPEGYYAQFVATDFLGPGDSYWIKTYRNGILLNNPFDITVAFDAGFSEGGNIDGVVFIQPIQDSVTPLNEDLDEIEPYQIGDSLYVEIHSISNEAFNFLQQVQIQTQRSGGFGEIFAQPLENVSTNIRTLNNASQNQVIGFFNVAGIEGRGRRLEE